jgi:hypothetical protein
MELTTSKLKQMIRRDARVSQGMSPEPDSLSERSLGLSYEASPKIKTKTELYNLRKLMDINNEISNTLLGYYKTPEERLKQREEKYRLYSPNHKTLSQVISDRKQENIEYNLKNFALPKVGIHKQELPRFELYKKDYWTADNTENNFSPVLHSDILPIIHGNKSKSIDINSKPNHISNQLSSYYIEEDINNKKIFKRPKLEKLVSTSLKIPYGSSDSRFSSKKTKLNKIEEEKSSQQSSSIEIRFKHIRSKGFNKFL